MPAKPLIVFCLAVASLTFTPRAHAVEPQLSAPFLVNTYTTGYQRSPVSRTFDDDTFLVLWNRSTRQLEGRQYNGDGTPIGAEFLINTYTHYIHVDARVAHQPSGSFVVVWSSQFYSIGGDDDGAITARLFDGPGMPVGLEFQVNTYTTGFQIQPGVAYLPGGDFVVVWSGYTATEPATASVIAQRFASNGTAVGGEFVISEEGNMETDDSPVIAADGSTGAIVAWEHRTAGNVPSIRSRRLDSSGTPVGTSFTVSTNTLGFLRDTDIARLTTDDYIVVWSQQSVPGDDGRGVRGRFLDASGAPFASEFAINSYTTGDQDSPRVAAGPDGTFVVGWHGDEGAGADDLDDVAVAACFDATGTATQTDFQVNVFTSEYQGGAVPALNSVGEFLVLWDDGDESDHDADGDESGVFARVLENETCGNGALDDGEECDDGNTVDGDCCGSTCLFPTGCADAGKSGLIVKDNGNDARNLLLWKWTRGTIATADFGDPTTDQAYNLCIFDDDELVLEAGVDAAGTCKLGKPCWKPIGGAAAPKGFKYNNAEVNSDGIRQLLLKGGTGRAIAKLKGQRSALALPGPAVPGTRYFNQNESVRVQLHRSGTTTCLESSFPTATRNTDRSFIAR